jgi:hypothetical protein
MSRQPSFLLPGDDPAEYAQLLAALTSEYKPDGPTESFLVDEIAEAQWKLRRIGPVEGDLIRATGAHYLADAYAKAGDHLLKLSRYESTLRRNWYRAVKELRMIRREKAQTARNDSKPIVHSKPIGRSNAIDHSKPIQQLQPVPPAIAPDNSKPMPEHLARELAAHQRRDPFFDPQADAGQMSKALRNWFQKHPLTTHADLA